MNPKNFENLPDHSKLWVFAFSQELTPQQRGRICDQLEGFLPGWVAHEVPVQGAYAVLEDRFVLVAGDCPDGISGCSMDSLVANFKALKTIHGLDGLDRNPIYYRDGAGRIQCLNRLDFQSKVAEGGITPQTRVFDTTIQRLDQLRRGELERPFESCWHSRAFPLPVGA